MVTAIKEGKATTKDGNKTANCSVTVKAKVINVTEVKLDKTDITKVEGETEQLTATVLPDNATNKTVIWSSSDKSIATVNDKGLVTAVKKGTTTITVTTKDGNKTATCNVTVKAKVIHVTEVKLNKTAITKTVDEIEQLTATVLPENATNKTVTWSSSNEAIVIVDAAGKVTTVEKGTATITVTTKDGNKTATCEVTVKSKYPEDLKVLVKGGTFKMGSNNGYDNEKPIHSVTVSDFYIGKYEVTNAQFVEFLNAKGNQREGGDTWLDIDSKHCQIYKDNGIFKVKDGKENYPVMEVTWYGARACAQWLGGRLPSEAEWEYAARGGNKSKGYKYSGSNIIGHVAWYSNNSGRHTHTVGTKKANELGIYDMTGNVWEWCEDTEHDNYNGAPTDGTAWVGNNYMLRMRRGGSWFEIPKNSRVACRGYERPDITFDDDGFRVAFDKK